MLLLRQEPCQGYDVSVDGLRWVDRSSHGARGEGFSGIDLELMSLREGGPFSATDPEGRLKFRSK